MATKTKTKRKPKRPDILAELSAFVGKGRAGLERTLAEARANVSKWTMVAQMAEAALSNQDWGAPAPAKPVVARAARKSENGKGRGGRGPSPEGERARNLIMGVLEEGPLKLSDMLLRTGLTRETANTALTALKRADMVKAESRGTYRRLPDSDHSVRQTS